MKIATWNVNSLKVRLPHVLQWLTTQQPDILALQETKLVDEKFPVASFQEHGYEVVFSGQKTYNGVAVLARTPLTDPVTDPPHLEDAQRRILAVTTAGLRIINLYVVNGEALGSEKYAYKLDWLRRMRDWLAEEIQAHPQTIVLGDFNIAPEDLDVHDPQYWQDSVLCSAPERLALQRIMQLGFLDSYRLQDKPETRYSWFDYRAASFRRNLGLRIDLLLLSKALADRCECSEIDLEPRGWERPSDHAPAYVVLKDPPT